MRPRRAGEVQVTSAVRHPTPALGEASTMHAMLLREWGGAFEQARRPVPNPGHGEVLVRVIAVGAGITNQIARLGVLGGSLPRIPGHELSGRVVSAGGGVKDWNVGDAVTASFYLVCRHCEWCTSGRETLCSNFGGFIGIDIDGTFAEFVTLPAANLVRIPHGVDVRTAGIVADAIATPYHVVTERLRMRAGQRVAVLGAGGGLGVHMLQMIRAFGGVAIAIEREPAKVAEIASRDLADDIVVPTTKDWATQVRSAAGDRLDGLVDTVASSATLDEGFRALGVGGTLVAMGHDRGARMTLNAERLLLEELVVLGTRYATRAEIFHAMELVRLGKVTPIVGAYFPMHALDEALQAAQDQNVFGRIIIDVAEED